MDYGCFLIKDVFMGELVRLGGFGFGGVDLVYVVIFLGFWEGRKEMVIWRF